MTMRLQTVLQLGFVVTAMAGTGASARAGEPVAGEILRDRVLVKLRHVPHPGPAARGAELGVAALDRISEQVGATGARPIFRHPPRGHAAAAAADRIGLDRWY